MKHRSMLFAVGERVDQRRDIRVTVTMEADYIGDRDYSQLQPTSTSLSDTGIRFTTPGLITDMSCGGIHLGTDGDLPLGCAVTVCFTLPAGEHSIHARGRIISSYYSAESKRYFHGVAFTRMDPRDQQSIAAWCARARSAATCPDANEGAY